MVPHALSPTPGSTGVRFHPAAPRPRFLWQANLPLNWRLIDTHPDASPHRLQAIAEDFIPGHRFSRSDQKLIVKQLEALVTAARDSEVLLTFILPGVGAHGEPTSATLLFRWYDSSPDYASLATAKQALAGADTTTDMLSPRGQTWIKAEGCRQTGSVSNRRTSYNHQAFLPIATTTWMLVISGTAPDEASGQVLGELITRLANSVTVFPDTFGQTIEELSAGDSEDTQGLLPADTDTAGVLFTGSESVGKLTEPAPMH